MHFFQTLRQFLSGGATRVEKGPQHGSPDSYNASTAAHVTEDTALQVAAFWQGVRLLSETIASLPLRIHEKRGHQLIEANDSALSLVLSLQPNSRMTAFSFKRFMQFNLILHGNAYARIERNKQGQIIALWPMPSESIQPYLLDDGSIVYYRYHDNNITIYAEKSILHLRQFGNGLVGLSTLAYARNTLGLASASDNFAAKQFKSGGRPSGVVYTDTELNKSQRDKVRDKFSEIVDEKEESRRLIVLPPTFKYQQTQLNPEDMQLLESRHMNIEEISRFLNIPPILLHHATNTSTWGSGIEQIFIAWYRLGLGPILQNWQEEFERALMPLQDRQRYEIKFDFEHLLNGDSKTHMEYLRGLVGGPLITPNEGRARINLPPIDGGDRLNPAPTEARKSEPASQETPVENNLQLITG